MGSDIHLLFEQQNADGRWETMFTPTAHPRYWYDSILNEKMENGSASLMFAEAGRAESADDERVVYQRACQYFEAMSLDEAEARYGSSPLFCWGWYENMPHDPDENCPVIRSRNYDFFAAISGLRMERPSDVFFRPRGIPDGYDHFYQKMLIYDDEDAHTHSWLMVDELLSSEFRSFCELIDARHRAYLDDMLVNGDYAADFSDRARRHLTAKGEMARRIEWFERHIPHPDRTRMVFHFDC